jgi:hypothetical protein
MTIYRQEDEERLEERHIYIHDYPVLYTTIKVREGKRPGDIQCTCSTYYNLHNIL